ncbi:hypothetical protein [Actinoplanes flavus]|uniref:ATP/GTP-binding protein n=1 Tax=Actinoplanes flavus TaxID=2820290 RepID=A0ABS3UD19_9ACTN|nr:hypothetical protein [Actinoplanes flavus]MBO3736346.1 hypothetical protein [Actinoplanes flavus]
MSPRRNRPRSAKTDEERPDRPGITEDRVQQWQDGDYMVRNVFGAAAVKIYRCPGCVQEIRPGVAHVVAWPVDERGDLTDRRHWHTGCWRARDRRAPGVERSRSAPRYGR